jgi:RNA polymerase sigma factor (sigma-70 family)
LRDDRDVDAHALVAMLEAEHAKSFAWALACCAYDRSDAEDVVQQAYLRILDGRATFAGRSAPRTWLFGVIWRCAREQRRRATVRRVLSGRVLVELLSRAPEPVIDQLGSARDGLTIRRALRALSPNQREVIELVAYHDLTIEQAGRVLGMTASTARTHYERAKRRLAAIIPTEKTA